MKNTRYGLQVTVDRPYDDVLARTTAALKAEGFGVLTSIDVKATMKEKLDADFRRYVILGACNPPLAYKALTTDLEVGLLLPCNVVVYEEAPGRTVVTAVAPLTMLGAAGDDPELRDVASDADLRLRRAMAALDT